MSQTAPEALARVFTHAFLLTKRAWEQRREVVRMLRHHFRMHPSHTYHLIRPPLRRAPSARISGLLKTNAETAARSPGVRKARVYSDSGPRARKIAKTLKARKASKMAYYQRNKRLAKAGNKLKYDKKLMNDFKEVFYKRKVSNEDVTERDLWAMRAVQVSCDDRGIVYNLRTIVKLAAEAIGRDYSSVLASYREWARFHRLRVVDRTVFGRAQGVVIDSVKHVSALHDLLDEKLAKGEMVHTAHIKQMMLDKFNLEVSRGFVQRLTKVAGVKFQHVKVDFEAQFNSPLRNHQKEIFVNMYDYAVKEERAGRGVILYFDESYYDKDAALRYSFAKKNCAVAAVPKGTGTRVVIMACVTKEVCCPLVARSAPPRSCFSILYPFRLQPNISYTYPISFTSRGFSLSWSARPTGKCACNTWTTSPKRRPSARRARKRAGCRTCRRRATRAFTCSSSSAVWPSTMSTATRFCHISATASSPL